MDNKKYETYRPNKGYKSPRAPDGSFLKGHSGNPAGGRRGARNAFSAEFVRDMTEVWETHGKQAILTLAEFSPDKFVAIACRLVETDKMPSTELQNAYTLSLERFTQTRLGRLAEGEPELEPSPSAAEEELLK